VNRELSGLAFRVLKGFELENITYPPQQVICEASGSQGDEEKHILPKCW